VEAPRLHPEILDQLDAQWEYSKADWEASAGHRPLRDVDADGVIALATHVGWTNEARGWFYTLMELEAEAGREHTEVGLHEPWAGAMFVYYGLLWAVIEGCRQRRIRFLGPLNRDIRAIANDLQTTRHAVFHVGRPDGDSLYDSRLEAIMGNPSRQGAIERTYIGIARAIAEEVATRTTPAAEGRSPGSGTPTQ